MARRRALTLLEHSPHATWGPARRRALRRGFVAALFESYLQRMRAIARCLLCSRSGGRALACFATGPCWAAVDGRALTLAAARRHPPPPAAAIIMYRSKSIHRLPALILLPPPAACNCALAAAALNHRSLQLSKRSRRFGSLRLNGRPAAATWRASPSGPLPLHAAARRRRCRRLAAAARAALPGLPGGPQAASTAEEHGVEGAERTFGHCCACRLPLPAAPCFRAPTRRRTSLSRRCGWCWVTAH